MKQDQLKPAQPKKKKKRIGRGIAAGGGKTAGRGTKGQKSRSGKSIPTGFEGGQTPLKMRLPKKRGFFRRKEPVQIINLDKININFKKDEIVSPKTLVKKGLIKSETAKVKILADGNLEKSLIFENVIFSKTAEEKVKKSSKTKSRSPKKLLKSFLSCL